MRHKLNLLLLYVKRLGSLERPWDSLSNVTLVSRTTFA